MPPRIQVFLGDDELADLPVEPHNAWRDHYIPIPAGGPENQSVRVEIDSGSSDVYLSDANLVNLAAEPDRPNVLVILVDTLRRDHIQSYGYERDTTTHIAAFAEKAFIFDEATSSSSWTPTAIASLFTGFRPDRHGAMGLRAPLPEDLPAISEWLGTFGYHTIGVSANSNIRASLGFARGFDRFTQYKKVNDDKLLFATAVDGIEFVQGEPWFAYVHFMGPHSPYHPPKDLWDRYQEPESRILRKDIVAILQATANQGMGYAAQMLLTGNKDKTPCQDCPDVTERIESDALVQLLQDAYDAEIFNTDRVVGELLQTLRDLDAFQNTLVIFVADHGEEFWDHESFHHGQSLFDELIRVPLIIKPPGPISGPTRVNDIAQIVDLAPTIADYTGAPLTWTGNGISLRPAMEGQQLPRRLAVAQLQRRIGFKLGATKRRISFRVVRDATRKLIHDELADRWTFYDLLADPEELQPIEPLPIGNEDLAARMNEMPLLYRPGYNILIAMPRDRPAIITGTVLGENLPKPQFDTQLSERTVQPTNGGWSFRIATEPGAAYPDSSPYFNPILWIPAPKTMPMKVSLSLDGRPFPEERIEVYNQPAPLDANEALMPQSIITWSDPYLGAAVKDAPRAFIWYWSPFRESDSDELAPALKEELETLGYL